MVYFQLVLTNSSSQVHAFIIIFRHKIFNFFINLSRFIEKLFQVVLAMFEFFHHESHVAIWKFLFWGNFIKFLRDFWQFLFDQLPHLFFQF
jgi:hypothetical protein